MTAQIQEAFAYQPPRNEVRTFPFISHNVRIIVNNGAPWFIAKDVCEVLGIKQPVRSVENLDEDEVSKTHITDNLGRKQEAITINESGLYALILRSRKPEAKKFRKWVTNEVLPAIRQTGGYSVQKVDPVTQYHPGPKVNNEQLWQLADKINKVFIGMPTLQKKANNHLNNRLCFQYGIRTIKDLPAAQFHEAMTLVGTLKTACDDYGGIVYGITERFCAEIIGGNTPWLPHLARKYKAKFDENLPKEVHWPSVVSRVQA